MKNPFRYWMTGCVAIMFAGMSGAVVARGDDDVDIDKDRMTLTHISHYSVAETVKRIEASAHRHGLHVLACVSQPVGAARGEARYMIVFESSQGGTPVQMETADAPPDLLLSVVLRRGADGTEVFMPSGSLRDLPEGLPAEVQHDLDDLPAVLDDALSA